MTPEAPDPTPSLLRRRIAPAAGMALLLGGGALAVRVTAMTLLADARELMWLYTAAACVLAGVALVLVALPAIARGADTSATGTRVDQPLGVDPGAAG